MMISDGETNSSDPHREGSHAFPLLNNNASIDPTGTSGESGDCFKPLFHAAPMGEDHSPHKGLVVSCSAEDRNAEDSARRNGFERGFDEGKQDACDLIQEEMAPQIKSFADALSLWNAIMMRVEDKSNLQILKMAVAIAEKILGAPPQCRTGGLESLKSDLTARMRKAYQLEFKLNPKDLDSLSDFLTSESVHWGQWDYIAVTGDAEVQRGSLRLRPGTQGLSADESIIRSLDASLSEVSTK